MTRSREDRARNLASDRSRHVRPSNLGESIHHGSEMDPRWIRDGPELGVPVEAPVEGPVVDPSRWSSRTSGTFARYCSEWAI